MVTEDILAAQKSLLKGKYLKSYNNFMTCQKSYHKKPELVILSNGRHYIDGLDSCKCDYCYHCVKVYLYKASFEVVKAKDFIQKEKLRPTMLTLTLPHKATDSLKNLKITLDKATRNFLAESRNKLMKKINRDVNNTGYILRNEISYNEQNGWNVHVHVLNLQKLDFTDGQKSRLVDNFVYLLEDSGFYFSRLDRYNIEKRERLVRFNDNFTNTGYIAKFDGDNPVYLAQSNPSKYIEFAQSFNITQKIPLIKFKNGLKSKINKSLNLSEEEKQAARELRRIELPESLIGQPLEEIEKWLM